MMLHEIKKYLNLKSPLFQFTIVLFIYSALALINLLEFDMPSWWLYSNNELFYKSLISQVLIITVMKIGYLSAFSLFKMRNLNPLHFAITGIIIYLLLHPTQDLWVFPTVAFITVICKLLVRLKNKPIFNPAAFGMLASYYIIQLFSDVDLKITWWGTDFGSRSINIGQTSISIFPVIFSVLFFYFAYKFRKHIYGLSFLISFLISLLIYYFLTLEGITLRTALELILIGLPTWFFMTFVMIVEPKTSPIQKNKQIFLGIFGGILYLLFAKYAKDVQSPELHIILFLNLLTFLFFSNVSQTKTWFFKRTTKFTVTK